jgi:hypothetical protein
MKNKNYYLDKSIELAEASKKTITLETSIIYELSNDSELGKEVRKRITEKINEVDQHIKHLKELIEDRS